MIFKISRILILLLLTPSLSMAETDLSKQSSRCSRYFSLYEKSFGIPDNLLAAVAATESGIWDKKSNTKVPWPWTINAQGKGYRFDTKQEAIQAVKDFQKQGIESIDVGCMQVNLKYHPGAFRSLQQAFEPKYNIGYAAKLLRENRVSTQNWKTAIARYHSGNHETGMNYVEKVYANWYKNDKSFSVALNESNISVSGGSEPNQEIRDITKDVLEQFGME